MLQTILAGARAPRALRLTVTPGNTDADLTAATAVTLSVRGRDGATQTWETTIDDATESALVCRHVFDDGGLEVASPGRLSIVATIETPDGPLDAGPFYLNVIDR